MTKVNVTNHNLKILQFLLNERMLSEGFLSTSTDICLRQARFTLEKELNIKIDQSTFDDAIRAEVV